MPERYTLLRTGSGDAPLSFMGTLIQQVFTRERGMQDRWYELTAYEATGSGGSYAVVAIGYRSDRNHEVPLDWVWWGLSTEVRRLAINVSVWAMGYDISHHILGIPGGDQFEGKREQVVRSLRAHLLMATSELLGSIPGAVEEL